MEDFLDSFFDILFVQNKNSNFIKNYIFIKIMKINIKIIKLLINK